jgi:NTP pyrophosphatase (non-canonical NTP hydrolase)
MKVEYSKLQRIVYEPMLKHGFYNKWAKARDILKKYKLDGMVDLAELALMHTEISEACEEVRNIDKEATAKELAGLQIRLFNYANFRGIDLEKYVISENERNKARPVLHGRKFI